MISSTTGVRADSSDLVQRDTSSGGTNYATEIPHCYAVSRVDNTTSCRRTGYDGYILHILRVIENETTAVLRVLGTININMNANCTTNTILSVQQTVRARTYPSKETCGNTTADYADRTAPIRQHMSHLAQ